MVGFVTVSLRVKVTDGDKASYYTKTLITAVKSFTVQGQYTSLSFKITNGLSKLECFFPGMLFQPCVM
jgi:hypothetical protein